jgi:succinate dehydrogenase / fumarate reductase cytochrome b subunit
MTRATAAKARPKYLNVAKIRLPIPGFVSILHRVSGAGLFLLLPLLIWLLDASLASSDGFSRVKSLTDNPPIKLILLVVLWALLHHFLAGIRYLLLDLQAGMELGSARASAWTVLGGSLLLTALLGARLW